MEEKGLMWVILAPGPGLMAVVSSWAGEPPGPGGGPRCGQVSG